MHCSLDPEPLEAACLKYHVPQEPGATADHVSSLEDHIADWLQQGHSAGLLQLAVMAVLVAAAASACAPPAAEGQTGFCAGALLRLVLVMDINAVAGRHSAFHYPQRRACLTARKPDQALEVGTFQSLSCKIMGFVCGNTLIRCATCHSM